jgi:V/A-type H+-transporting ATPase subunit D
MAQLTLSKSALQDQRRKLASYKRFLPSLELKRQQLVGERARAVAELAEAETALDGFLSDIGERLPMLANREIDLDGLVELVSLEQDRQNVVGVWLPRLVSFEVKVKDYSRLGRPAWVDVAAARLRDCVELNLRVRFARERVRILEKGVRQITQRVNLFDKILIPRTRRSIQRIQIYLGDTERAAVVRSKVAKRKRAAA